MKKNKSFYTFLLFFYILLYRDVLQKYFPFLGYIDEFISLLSIPLFCIRLAKSHFKIKTNNSFKIRWLILIFTIGCAGSLIYSYQSIGPVILDILLCFKFWLVIYVGYEISQSSMFEICGNKVVNHVKFNTIFLIILSILNYLPINIFYGEIRYGLKSMQLIYSLPTTLASSLAGLIAVLIVTKEYNKQFYFYFFSLLLMMCMTLRSKAIAAAMAIFLLYYFLYIRKKKFTIRTVLLFIPLMIAIAWDQIYFYFFSSIQNDSARYQLLVTSFFIANEHFPFGAGFASFGSAPSGTYYSPLYSKYNISNVNGLREGFTSYISDSFWPMIIGQFGWLGLFAMIFNLGGLYRIIQKTRLQSKSLYVGMFVIFIYLLIISIAESAFVHPNSIFLGFLLGSFLKTASYQRKK